MAFDKNAIRLAAFDLDGTIFDRGTLLPATRAAILRLRESGVETVIATGRHPFHLPDNVMDVPCFRYAIGSNGGIVADIRSREVFFLIEMEAAEARAIVRTVGRLSEAVHVVHREQGAIMRGDLDIILEGYADPARRAQVERDLKKMYRVTETFEEFVDGIREPVIKLGVRFPDESATAAGAKALQAVLDCEVVITDNQMVEITPRGVSKALGLEKLCAHLGFAPENAVAFGDSGNDVDIMTRAGFSVAMGNASDDVKAVADYVTDTVENAGAAKAIEALFGI